MKNNRHNVIMSIVQSKKIRTHEQLINELALQGYSVTQATISRDIKLLGLSKFSDSEGAYYGIGADKNGFLYKYSDDAISINNGGNLVVIKTAPGTASAVAATLDNMLENEVLGSIAGDDTVFIAVKTEEKARYVTEKLRNFFKMGEDR